MDQNNMDKEKEFYRKLAELTPLIEGEFIIPHKTVLITTYGRWGEPKNKHPPAIKKTDKIFLNRGLWDFG